MKLYHGENEINQIKKTRIEGEALIPARNKGGSFCENLLMQVFGPIPEMWSRTWPHFLAGNSCITSHIVVEKEKIIVR